MGSFPLIQILETTITVLHLLRPSSTMFQFHLVVDPNQPGKLDSALVEGYGSLVLVNELAQDDRAMLLTVRPPAYNQVLREFARGCGGQWTECEGTATTLQAQVYDECVHNVVHHFVVTTTTHWVFGSFVSEPVYTETERQLDNVQYVSGHRDGQHRAEHHAGVSRVVAACF